MKVQIKESGREFTIFLPNGLIFNDVTLWIAGKAVRKHAPEALSGISPEAIERLFAELKRIQKKYGTWELVEIQSTNGEQIRITL